MTKYNTGNPVGSSSPLDLYDNAENLDNGINGAALTWQDRRGVTRKSFAGIESEFQQFLVDGSILTFSTYAEASAAAIDLNRQVQVIGDPGTHVDPVTGETVSNSGTFIKVGAGLQFVRPDVLAAKADKAAVDALVAKEGASVIAQRGVAKRNLTRDGVIGYAFPVLASDERVVGVTIDGGFSGAYLRVPGTAAMPARDTPLRVPVVQSDVDGRVGIGFDPETGFTFALLDQESVDHIKARIDGSPPIIRGGWGSNVYNVRHYADTAYNTATVSDRAARTYDARQLIAGVQPTLLMAAPVSHPLKVVLAYGQSNAGLGGSTGRLVSDAPWPSSTVAFAGVNGSSQQGTVHMSGAALTDFVAALDFNLAQTPAICSSYGITQYNAWAGRQDSGYVAATAWHGSQPITSFYPNAISGFWNYENAVTFLQRSVAIAGQYGRTAELDVMQWIQGEAGPAGRENYATQLDDLFNTILPGFKAATGQASDVKVAIWQTNMSKASAGENYASQGQWDVANARVDSFLAGPMYQFKLGDESTGPSTVHTGPEGRLMLGETYADVYASIVDTGAWKPIQPVSAVRSGNIIDVTFEGTMLDRPGAALAFDADWVPATLNHGFSYTDDASPPVVTAVALQGPRTVRITLATEPTGSGKKLRYAIDAFSDVPYWPTRRGNLMVETDRPSWWRRQGVNIPARVRHYSIRFEIPVTE